MAPTLFDRGSTVRWWRRRHAWPAWCPLLVVGVSAIVGTVPVRSARAQGAALVGDVAVCGDGVIEGDEQCDDGNSVGGDGCAANCTNESPRTCRLVEGSGATIQTPLFAIPFNLTGQLLLSAGEVRTSDPHQVVPFVIKTGHLQIPPVSVPDLVCVCIRGLESSELDGNVFSGTLGCGGTGLENTDYASSIDHVIGRLGVAGFTADDCAAAGGTLEDGSSAHPHVGVCNGPMTTTFSGRGPRGSMAVDSSVSISLIEDGGLCASAGGDPSLYGPDGAACTDDDPDQAAAHRFVLTTGTAEAQVLHANASPASINQDGLCRPCVTQVVGAALDCDSFVVGSDTALGGLSLAGAYGSLHDAPGDNVVTMRLACAPAATSTPTVTSTSTPPPTATPTATRTATPPPDMALALTNLALSPGQEALAVPILVKNAVSLKTLDFFLSNVPNDVSLNPGRPCEVSPRAGSASCTASQVGDAIRVSLSAAEAGGISPGDGQVATIYVDDTAPVCSLGSTTALSVSQVEATNNDGGAVSTAASDGSLFCGCKGDIDNNGATDVFDILRCVDFMLGQRVPTASQLGLADVVCDGKINFFDLVQIIDITLGRRLACPVCK